MCIWTKNITPYRFLLPILIPTYKQGYKRRPEAARPRRVIKTNVPNTEKWWDVYSHKDNASSPSLPLLATVHNAATFHKLDGQDISAAQTHARLGTTTKKGEIWKTRPKQNSMFLERHDLTIFFLLIFHDPSLTAGHSTRLGEEDFRVLVSWEVFRPLLSADRSNRSLALQDIAVGGGAGRHKTGCMERRSMVALRKVALLCGVAGRGWKQGAAREKRHCSLREWRGEAKLGHERSRVRRRRRCRTSEGDNEVRESRNKWK